jgi:hypothetical protein
MEPDVLVSREQPSHMWSNDTDDVPQHWDQDEPSIHRQDKTSTTRYPYGEVERIEALETSVRNLHNEGGIGSVIAEKATEKRNEPEYTIRMQIRRCGDHTRAR